MELYQLKTLLAVEEEKHLTRAAEKLSITQPAVSSQIKQLEEELGLILFTRTPRGMAVTGAGRQIAALARKVLNEAEKLQETARVLSGSLSGLFKLGVNTTVTLLKLDRLISGFALRSGDLKFQIINGHSHEIIKDVARGELDLGFAFWNDDMPVDNIKLAEMTLYIIGPKKLEEQTRECSLEELAGFRWILPPDWCTFRKASDRIYRSGEFNPRDYMISDDEQQLQDLAVEQGGFTFALKESIQEALDSNTLFIWPHETFTLELRVVYDRKKLGLTAFRTVLDAYLALWDKTVP